MHGYSSGIMKLKRRCLPAQSKRAVPAVENPETAAYHAGIASGVPAYPPDNPPLTVREPVTSDDKTPSEPPTTSSQARKLEHLIMRLDMIGSTMATSSSG